MIKTYYKENLVCVQSFALTVESRFFLATTVLMTIIASIRTSTPTPTPTTMPTTTALDLESVPQREN